MSKYNNIKNLKDEDFRRLTRTQNILVFYNFLIALGVGFRDPTPQEPLSR